ncbi:RNA-directed DNA polymerase [Chryseobacterium chendengshani]|uniref:RNA-directed DNA polymerase n=1 Tax=Chryseobacterium sp. LJ756 TaxID=2864113 RepID=UPI001C63DF71|nr:RNA-directed DNA polymerase [Chryseobacterium sp. LJ756]
MAKEYTFGSDQITKEELLFTYRKIKRELYYERDYHYIDKIVEFEENLDANIDFINKNLKQKKRNVFLLKENLGKCNFVFKNIRTKLSNDKLKVKSTLSNFDRQLVEIDKISFRYLGEVSIMFQIIGGLWLNRVGYKLDEKFPKNLYGCRIKNIDKSTDLPYFKQNHTIYKPYFSNYQKWQNDLFTSLESENDKSVVVLTTDFSKYYHSIKIDELRKKVSELIDNLEIKLTKVDQFLNDLLFGMINAFNNFNNKKYSWFKENELSPSEYGLPLTLNASKLLSNIFLLDFDKDIINNLKPIYYGRYVDDIILAIELGDEKSEQLNFSQILGNKLKKFKIESNVLRDQTNKSFNLKFNTEKECVFIFNSTYDKVELNNLKKVINKNSSEWNLFPITEEYDHPDKIDLFYNINQECEEVNSLRKSNGLVIKRNKFVREIINFETSIKFYQHKIWQKRLNNFLDVTYDYIFELKNFIDLIKYVPRLFGLIVHSKNESISQRYYSALYLILEIIKRYKEINKSEFSFAKDFLIKKIKENIIYSNSLNLIDNVFLVNKFELEHNFSVNVLRYFRSDLHMLPYKTLYFKYKTLKEQIGCSLDELVIKSYTKHFFTEELVKFLKDELNSKNKNEDDTKYCTISSNSGFYYFTRRITLLELSISLPNTIVTKPKKFKLLAEKYYHKYKLNIPNDVVPENYKYINFPDTKSVGKPKICNTHFFTDDSSFDAVVRGLDEPDISRNDRFFNILNDIIRRKNEVDYVVFHELSLPRNIFMPIAERLGRLNINLIAGLEYAIKNEKNRNFADNQLFYSLTVNDGMSGSVGLFQSKLVAAIHESSELWNKNSIVLQPKFHEKYIIKHNNFVFSGLICNDLLDINNRAFLRGYIDTLFVIAWNQDIETYYHVVKSSCLDIHCFINLCNNKKYGDIRLSAPYKKSWSRDLHIIHGGKFDNFMISNIDISSLRNYQNNNIPPSEPFKPFPTGFNLWKERKDNSKT